jgi:hypothetical protein
VYLRSLRWAATLVLVVTIGSSLANAQSFSKYTFVLGSGFLCDSSDSTCPATARAARGDSYELSGAGTFDLQDKSVKGAGTFTHKSTNGHVLETGVWTASELVSFASYGIAPGALKKGLGPQHFGSKRSPIVFGPMPTGGLAIFRILLLPTSGVTKTAVLQVNSALGEIPSERSVEGIRLTLERYNSEYSEESGGRMMFLLLRSEGSGSGTTLQRHAGETAEPSPN